VSGTKNHWLVPSAICTPTAVDMAVVMHLSGYGCHLSLFGLIAGEPSPDGISTTYRQFGIEKATPRATLRRVTTSKVCTITARDV